jgi:hypothetical protein
LSRRPQLSVRRFPRAPSRSRPVRILPSAGAAGYQRTGGCSQHCTSTSESAAQQRISRPQAQTAKSRQGHRKRATQAKRAQTGCVLASTHPQLSARLQKHESVTQKFKLPEIWAARTSDRWRCHPSSTAAAKGCAAIGLRIITSRKCGCSDIVQPHNGPV